MIRLSSGDRQHSWFFFSVVVLNVSNLNIYVWFKSEYYNVAAEKNCQNCISKVGGRNNPGWTSVICLSLLVSRHRSESLKIVWNTDFMPQSIWHFVTVSFTLVLTHRQYSKNQSGQWVSWGKGGQKERVWERLPTIDVMLRLISL